MEISSTTNPKMNLSVKKKESVHKNAALAIISAIKGTSHEKIYKKLGLE